MKSPDLAAQKRELQKNLYMGKPLEEKIPEDGFYR